MKIFLTIFLDTLSFFILRNQGIDIVSCLWISYLAGLIQISRNQIPTFLGMLFLRGAVFALLQNFSLYMVIPLISIFSHGGLYFSKKMTFSLILYSLFLRLFFLGLPNVTPEEAYYWNYSKHLSGAFLDHPPLVSWMIGIGNLIFGHGELGVRIGGIFFWALLALYSFLFGKNFLKESSTVPIIILSFFPLYFGFSFFITPDIALFAFWIGSIYFLERIFFSENGISWLGLGIFMGLGMLSKYTISLLGISALIFILVDGKSRKWLKSPWPYLSLLIIIIIFSPVLYWNYRNNWASFEFQTIRRFSAPIEFSFHHFLWFIFLQITPLGILAFIRRSNFLSLDKRHRLFMGIFTLVPLCFFAVYSVFHEMRISWTAPIFLSAIPLFVLEFKRKSIYPALATVIVLFYGFVLHYLTLGIPGMPYLSQSPKPVAWKEMAGEISRLKKQDTIVGMDKYMIASELAFYLNEPFRVMSSHIFGKEGLMYGYWFQPSAQIGKNILMVSFKADDLSDFNIGKFFKKLDPIQSRRVFKLGKQAGKFYYRLGYHFFLPSRSDSTQ